MKLAKKNIPLLFFLRPLKSFWGEKRKCYTKSKGYVEFYLLNRP